MAHYLVWRSLISPPQFQGAAYPSSVSEKMLFSSLLLCFTRLNYVSKTAIFNPKMRRSQKILSPTAWEMSWPSPWQSNRFVIITPVDKIFAFEDLAILLTCAICNFNFRKWNVDWFFGSRRCLLHEAHSSPRLRYSRGGALNEFDTTADWRNGPLKFQPKD